MTVLLKKASYVKKNPWSLSLQRSIFYIIQLSVTNIPDKDIGNICLTHCNNWEQNKFKNRNNNNYSLSCISCRKET